MSTRSEHKVRKLRTTNDNTRANAAKQETLRRRQARAAKLAARSNPTQ